MAEIARTYRIDPNPEALGGYTITCLLCGLTSAHPADVAELFCARCDRFHEDPVAESPLRPRQPRRPPAAERSQMSDLTYEQIAKSVYAAYTNCVVGKNHAGLPLPTWEDLPPHRQWAWQAAAQQAEICLLSPETAASMETQWRGWRPPAGEAHE